MIFQSLKAGMFMQGARRFPRLVSSLLERYYVPKEVLARRKDLSPSSPIS